MGDPRVAKDLLVRDATDAQKRNGMQPDTREVESFWVETLERVDQKRTANPAPPKPAPTDDDPGDTRDAAAIIRDGDQSDLGPAELLRGSDPRLQRARARRKVIHTREELLLYARWRALLQLPEWKQRLLNAHAQASTFNPQRPREDSRTALHREVTRVLADSDRVFGDWRKQKLGDPR